MKEKMLIIENKNKAYFATLNEAGKWVLGIATENESGYHLVKPESDLGGEYASELEATAVADECNKRLGIEPRAAAMIVMSSIRVSDVKRDDEAGGGVRRRPHRTRGKRIG